MVVTVCLQLDYYKTGIFEHKIFKLYGKLEAYFVLTKKREKEEKSTEK